MIEMEQGSPTWHAIRCGKVTASRVSDVMARTKTGWGASRANYMAELICERLTLQPAPSFTSAAMMHGTDTEPLARAAYEFRYDCAVEQIGFAPHPTISASGASPDGLIGADGLLEIKCPNTSTHLDTLLGQKVPEKYVNQCMWQMACTGRKWCDFLSFDPRVPSRIQMFVKRIERDDAVIADMEKMVSDFLAELDAKIAMLDQLYSLKEAAE